MMRKPQTTDLIQEGLRPIKSQQTWCISISERKLSSDATYHPSELKSDGLKLPKPPIAKQLNKKRVIGIDKWLNTGDLRETLMVLRAVNHKVRKRIMRFLDENNSMTVTEIYISMRLEQSVVSQHLSILRKAGVVITEKKGKYISYSLNEGKLDQLSELLIGLCA